MTSIIYLNGTRVNIDFPLRTIFYGDGVFETFRCKGKLPVYLEKHIERLRQGADLLSIPFPQQDQLIENIDRTYRDAGLEDANLKVCLLPEGENIFYKKPEDVSILVSIREIVQTPDVYSIARIQVVERYLDLEKVLARREALDKGFDDAVFANLNNEITETSSSNIFWVRGKGLYTPSVNCGLLPGITRDIVIDIMRDLGFQINERRFGLSYMLNSDFVFITNSISGIIFVNRINELKMPEPDVNYEKLKKVLYNRLQW